MDIFRLVYVPDYSVTNHLHKYDSLFISYDKEIVPTDDNDFPGYSGFDYVISGSIIVDFVKAVAEYSDYDVSSIIAEIEKKTQWFGENNGEEKA